MNQGWIYREQVKPSEAGITLLDYYSQHYRHSTRDQWRDRILNQQILINNHPATAQTRLKAGQNLAYHRPPWQEPDVPLSFEVIYEDADLLILNKPSGLPVMPGGGFLEHTLLWQLQQRYPQNTPIPIHRLGRGTSGLLLMARSQSARAHLSQQLRDRRMCKIYRALVGSGVKGDRFSITHPIGKIDHPKLGYIYGATTDGLAAQSDCQVLQRNPQTTLLAVTILTGRPHQIRIHLAAIGHPLVGDPLYIIGGGFRQIAEGEQLAVPGDIGYYLHAYQLGFIHPQTEKTLQFVAKVPDSLKTAMELASSR